MVCCSVEFIILLCLIFLVKKEDIRSAGIAVNDVRQSNDVAGSINVVDPGDAKGLEFDAVVIVEPELVVASDERGLRLLYVALTRSTQHLSIVHEGRPVPLPELPSVGAGDMDRSGYGEPLTLGGEEPVGAAATGAVESLDSSGVTRITRAVAQELVRQIRAEVPKGNWAALLHDVGKRSILPNLLQKPGALTDDERKAMQLHPTRGFEELCLRPDLTRGQLMMVYQHHERLDGSGYPVRAVAADIHWMAGICAVVDVFDALTGHRPYRRPASAEEALAHLSNRAGTEYDDEAVRCWASLVHESKAVCA